MEGFRHSSSGIDWYCEKGGTGPFLVLVPSGEGDCASYRKVAENLSSSHTVITFDTPGFSRSGPPLDLENISMAALAGQVACLMNSLEITSASFYGCSSGGFAVLQLLCSRPDLVHRALVHEAAIVEPSDHQKISSVFGLLTMTDSEIVAACQDFYMNTLCGNPAAWRALGDEYHKRLERNYVTWVRNYVAKAFQCPPIAIGDLDHRRLTWTVGGSSTTNRTIGNIQAACRAGLEIDTLPCSHFPHVSIPEELATHIRGAVD